MFRPKRLKNHTLWRHTYQYSLCKGVPTPTPRGHKPHPISDQKGSKTIPFGATHTNIAYVREYPPPPPGGTNLTLFQTQQRLKNHTLWRHTYQYSLCKGVPTPTPRGHKPHPISDQKGSKTIPFGATHTNIAYVREYPPPPPGGTNLTLFQTKKAQKPYPLAPHIPI